MNKEEQITKKQLLKLKKRQEKEIDNIIEPILARDPAGVYMLQDVATRSSCRKVIKEIAKENKVLVKQVASRVLDLAQSAQNIYDKSDKQDSKKLHKLKCQTLVSYWLISEEGLNYLKESEGYKLPLSFYIKKFTKMNCNHLGFFDSQWSLLLFGTMIVGSQFGINLTNFFCTKLLPPSVIPRLDFLKGIPDDHRTMVIVPTMLSSKQSIQNLLQDLVSRYLVNKDKNLLFALLTDFCDCKTETAPNDDELLQYAVKGIKDLNQKFKNEQGYSQHFYLFHRPRQFNASEGVYMGWERKRGKLINFMEVLRGGSTSAFSKIVGKKNLPILQTIKYVITLDSDTILPADTARRLVGNAAHIMNKPIFDKDLGRVTQGYGILQPRASLTITGAFQSRYSFINSSGASLDPYTNYVSDVYQDTFGEGSFVGKGLLNVDAFHEIGKKHFPENRILSHDLLEGCYLRAALVSDTELLEEYPSSYLIDASRRHRWGRGDWQIASWLFSQVPAANNEIVRNPLSFYAKWKIFDNLRRSFVPTAMFSMLIYGWISYPLTSHIPLYLTLSILSVPLLPFLIGQVEALVMKDSEKSYFKHFADMKIEFIRRFTSLGLELMYAPYESYNYIHAMITVYIRLCLTKQNLLEWNTCASDTQRYSKSPLLKMWRVMWVVPLVNSIILIILISKHFNHGYNEYQQQNFMNLCLNSIIASFALVSWIFSPLISWYISQPFTKEYFEPENIEKLHKNDVQFLRLLTRKTWRFFEKFVRKEDHYLPLDNYQEFPGCIEKRATSPTNIGMALLSNIAAFNFGFITQGQNILRMSQTLLSMDKLERFRGHFYNWYHTDTAKPFDQKYISTVDSGNLTACLMLLRTFFNKEQSKPILSQNVIQGLQDTIICAQESLQKELNTDANKLFQTIQLSLNSFPSFEQLDDVVIALQKLQNNNDKLLKMFSKTVKKQSSENPEEEVEEIVSENFYISAFSEQLKQLSSEIQTFFSFRLIPSAKSKSQNLNEKLKEIIYGKSIFDIKLEDLISFKDIQIQTNQSNEEEKQFIYELILCITEAVAEAEKRITQLQQLEQLSAKLAEQDYKFLYNTKKSIFSIGYDVVKQKLDKSHYDTLCSEARIASFVAISQGQIPIKHWFQLGRKLLPHHSRSALQSWSGSMFEYLMPLLIMPSHQNSLLQSTYSHIVEEQIKYGQMKQVPWGISESAIHVINDSGHYHYVPNGVPHLGASTDHLDHLVVTPYATAMAMMVRPIQATQNLHQLDSMGIIGEYGLYESLDYTPSRINGTKYMPVRSYFSHHSGMSMLGLTYALQNKPMQKLFNMTPEFWAHSPLLEEKLPVCIQSDYKD